jgi:hypothetical protein
VLTVVGEPIDDVELPVDHNRHVSAVMERDELHCIPQQTTELRQRVEAHRMATHCDRNVQL